MNQNYINHIALVLDASGSMGHLQGEVIKVADLAIADMARRSTELDQETRVTVYTFAGHQEVKCIVFDKDVLRLPSIKEFYRPDGQTALVDATMKALDDLSDTSELYGDHAFLMYVLTDGQENNSKHWRSVDLKARLEKLPDHWTVACFVPNQISKHEAKMFGFPSANIAVWDATSARGAEEAGETIRATTSDFMRARSTGVRGSKTIFDLHVNLSKQAQKSLKRLHPGEYRMFDVKRESTIAPFIERQTRCQYVTGSAYYQLMKKETIQPHKQIAIYDKRDYAVYTGANARKVLGLPDADDVRVAPDANPDFEVYVQSTSVNRKLLAGTKVLLIA